MIVLMGRYSQTNTPKRNKISRIVIILFLILVLLVITGCAPQVNTADLVDSQAALTSVSADSATPDSNLAENTAPTASPTAVPTNTQVPSTTFTFISDADSYIKQSEPGTSFGDKPTLRVDSGSDADESLVHFTVTELTGPVQRALLRLYATANGSKNGPVVYATSDSWSENEITWDQRPLYGDDALDNKAQIDPDTWVEYDVTSVIHGNGTFSFVLAADSEDAVAFSSREGVQSPQLVITFIAGAAADPTPTPVLSTDDVTLVGAGDISMCTNDNDELTAQLLDNIPGTVFTTGDGAYDDGSYSQYVECYDPTWGRHKDRTHPVPGNHDYHTADTTGYFQYFDNIPSYYAYDLSSWRIYALNSEIELGEDSAQVKWLQADLAANPRKCVLAYWHEPRWSSGSTHADSRSKRVLWKTLYEAGAELVLNGHEHNYERFMPMNTEGQPDPLGLREIVVGTGGGPLYPFGPALPTTEVRNNTTHGVLKLTLHADSYDWEFVPVAGSTFTDSGSTQCH